VTDLAIDMETEISNWLKKLVAIH